MEAKATVLAALILTATAGGAVATETVDEDTTDTIVIEGGNVWASLSNSSVSLEAVTDKATVKLSNIGDGDSISSGTIEAEGINEDSEDHANTGLCAVGLSGEKSPIDTEVDGENSSATVEFRDSEDVDTNHNPHAGKTASEIVDECTSG